MSRRPAVAWTAVAVAFAPILCVLFLVGSPAVRASAWNPPAGTGFLSVDVTLDGGDRYFDAKGRLVPVRSYRSTEGAAYIEYGITDWLMAVARPSLEVTRLGSPDGGRYVGPGATEAGAQLHLLTFGPAILAVQGTFRLPGTASRTNPATVGNTAREADARLLGGVGFSIGPLPAFLDLQMAYRARSDGAAPQWHGDATLGISVTPDWLVLVQSFNQVPLGPGTAWYPNSSYSKLEVSLVRSFMPGWEAKLGGFATVAGRGALRERGLVLGIWHRF